MRLTSYSPPLLLWISLPGLPVLPQICPRSHASPLAVPSTSKVPALDTLMDRISDFNYHLPIYKKVYLVEPLWGIFIRKCFGTR